VICRALSGSAGLPGNGQAFLIFYSAQAGMTLARALAH